MANQKHLEKLLEGVEAWNAWRKKNPQVKPDLSKIDFSDLELVKDTPLYRNMPFGKRSTKGLVLRRADFSNTNFHWSNLTAANCGRSNFRNAIFRRANLTGVDFFSSDLRGAEFTGATLTDLRAFDVIYRRAEMSKKFQGIKDVSSVSGDAIFVRDMRDQDFIDTLRSRWTRSWWDPRRFFLFWPWAAIDYGRSIVRALLIAAIYIALFGSIYSLPSIGSHVHVFVEAGPENWFQPYFVAAVAFSTLSFTDLMLAKSIIGQIIIILNVLSGYFNLGLILSILANNIARRA